LRETLLFYILALFIVLRFGPQGLLLVVFIWLLKKTLTEFIQFMSRMIHGDSIATHLMNLCAGMLTADGEPDPAEIHVVAQHLVRYYGNNQSTQYLSILQERIALKTGYEESALFLRKHTDTLTKNLYFQLMCEVAASDGNISAQEFQRLTQFGAQMGLNQWAMLAVMSAFPAFYSYSSQGSQSRSSGSYHYSGFNTAREPQGATASDYNTLELPEDATWEQVRSNYRTLVKKYHPDKAAAMGEEFRKSAEEKFKKIQAAYERIRTSKGEG
jgi:DnaJ like chaperone protein